MARKLGVDIARVAPSGTDGTVTMDDVKRAAADGSGKRMIAPVGGPSGPTRPAIGAEAPPTTAAAPAAPSRSTLSQSGKPTRTQPPGVAASGQPEQLKGVRRNMARVMADAHAQVVPTTLVDDADLHAWLGRQDITARLVRSIVAAIGQPPCVQTEGLSRSQMAALQHYGGLQLQPGSRQSDCAWLLTDTHPRTTARIDPQQWHWQTQMARPTDRGDFIRIYRRRAATE